MGINILVRNLAEDKINADYEAVELKKVRKNETFEEHDWGKVLSIYTSKDGSTTHYRVQGIQNSYFRKAKGCNDIIFNDDDIVYARLKAIDYAIPETGVPTKGLAKYWPEDKDMGGIVEIAGYSLLLASGEVIASSGRTTCLDVRVVEDISLLSEGLVNLPVVKFKGDGKWYIINADRSWENKILSDIEYAQRKRASLVVEVGTTRPIMPVVILHDDGIPTPEDAETINKSKPVYDPVVYILEGADASTRNRIKGDGGEGSRLGKIKSAILAEDREGTMWLTVEDAISHEVDYITLRADSTGGGWNLRSDLLRHTRSWTDFEVLYKIEPAKKPESKKPEATSATVIWSAGEPAKVSGVGTYVTAIAIPAHVRDDFLRKRQDDNIRNHMSMLEHYIPGLKWEEVEEVRGNFDVVVRGSIITGTAGGKEHLAKQMNGDISVVLVGILSL